MTTGAELREMMETILPETVLSRVARASGFQQRERKRDAVKFLRTMVIAAASPAGGRQADVMRQYFEGGGESVVRGSFYDWFGPPLEAALVEMSGIVLERVRRESVDLPGVLGHVVDWRIVDSTTVKLSDRLFQELPGAGDYAAVKVHKTLSVGRGAVVDYHFSPARDHDSPHLVLDESWRGMGLLADLGYASTERLRDCQRFGVSVVIRLKDGWKPKVDRVARADMKRTFVPDTDLDLFLHDVYLELGNVIDVDVRVGADDLPLRLVGVLAPGKGYRFYLTNLPRSVGPHSVADLYRVRWEIETNNKLDKSSHRLDEIDATRPEAVRALLHASMISSMIIGLIVHRYNSARASDAGPRTTAPLHHGLVARMLSTSAFRIACALELDAHAADADWDDIADLLVHCGKDPNWRRKPSILDQLRGWAAPSGASQRLSARRCA